MKVVILAGGFGTRISEESHLKPKPMIEIGDKPILWHIMKTYLHYGFNEFIICCGYKAHIIKQYFSDYYLHNSDIVFDFKQGNQIEILSNTSEPWKVTVVDTGLNTMTGGRIKRVKEYIGNETFMLTYGDGVSDVDLIKLLNFHKQHGRTATLTAVQPEGRFGVLELEGSTIKSFREKSRVDSSWINAGFMVLNPEIFDYIENDETILENEPLEHISRMNDLMAYKHKGFWKCMDTQRDKHLLEELWGSGHAPWALWTK